MHTLMHTQMRARTLMHFRARTRIHTHADADLRVHAMVMGMFMRMWMRNRISETGGPCLARFRCAHAARVAVAGIRAAGRLPFVCVCVRMLIHTVWVARARVRDSCQEAEVAVCLYMWAWACV